ncbi:hypothetical protein CBA19CS22_08060 [Caballeronia novacaledonica]|jgi:hypothetical protein|uniref:Uncharacterized protein n=1 Tax=Caballeronia novacaledonica TaxID=1544861 RepID=A0ACB5QMQ6_9BURK|nr:hypothetical protein [Caballeronia sp. EK]KAK48019.1 hypothetical protein BG58_36065 [Caballeronia jiangsuensis]MBC8635322.1 hypothetical protein [Caballeronia sp. EK]GJH16476.1 hypothetical protein CBA19CS22_08060 [Caballeronia novacaledonica]
MDALTHQDAGAFAREGYSLADLWHRRASLSDIEIGHIYRLVLSTLRSYYPPELRGLHEDKEELISQFFFSRVLRLDSEQRPSHASAESAPSTAYALCAYFRRFLIDCLRSASLQRNLSLEVDGVQDEVDSRAHAPDDPVEATLADFGLNEARVRAFARVFIAMCDAPDRLILAGSLGASSERKGGLKGVAEQYDVPSYHYRARKLGVTMKKDATPACFAATKIGRWMVQTLGIEITPENRDAILIVLNLLALEAHE